MIIFYTQRLFYNINLKTKNISLKQKFAVIFSKKTHYTTGTNFGINSVKSINSHPLTKHQCAIRCELNTMASTGLHIDEVLGGDVPKESDIELDEKQKHFEVEESFTDYINKKTTSFDFQSAPGILLHPPPSVLAVKEDGASVKNQDNQSEVIHIQDSEIKDDIGNVNNTHASDSKSATSCLSEHFEDSQIAIAFKDKAVASMETLRSKELQSEICSHATLSPKLPVLTEARLSITQRILNLAGRSGRHVLPVDVVDKVTETTKQVVAKGEGFKAVEPVDNIEDIIGGKIPQESAETDISSVTDETDDTMDISVLFSDSYENAYKCSVTDAKHKKKKNNKKRKHQDSNEEGQARKGEKKIKRNSPNFFLAIQIADPVILANARTVQQYMLNVNEDIKAALINVATLHLTLLVLRLSDEQQINKALEVLKKLQHDPDFISLNSEPLQLQLSGMGHFRDQVVFIQLAHNDRLQQIAERTKCLFEEEGMISPDQKGFTPHITLLKLSKAPQLRKSGVKKVTSEYYAPYKDSVFGSQIVESIQLCSMLNRKQESGYYHVENEISCHVAENENSLEIRKTKTQINNVLLKLHSPSKISCLIQNSSRELHTMSSCNTLHISQQPLTWNVQLEKQLTWIFVTNPNTENSVP